MHSCLSFGLWQWKPRIESLESTLGKVGLSLGAQVKFHCFRLQNADRATMICLKSCKEEVPSKAHPTMDRKGDGEARTSYDHFEGQYGMELAKNGPGWIRTTKDWMLKSRKATWDHDASSRGPLVLPAWVRNSCYEILYRHHPRPFTRLPS